MKQKQWKISKTILAIVSIVIIAIGSFVLFYYITFDPYMGVKPDMGIMGDDGRPAEGISTSIPLGNTEFVASLTRFFYTDEDDKDWDYCTIEVCRRKGDSDYIFFERRLDISDVPEGIIKGHVFPLREAGVVTFDEDSGTITFTIGEKTFTYKLPQR